MLFLFGFYFFSSWGHLFELGNILNMFDEVFSFIFYHLEIKA